MHRDDNADVAPFRAARKRLHMETTACGPGPNPRLLNFSNCREPDYRLPGRTGPTLFNTALPDRSRSQVVFVDGRLSFDHLQHGMASRPAAVAWLVREHPASYVAFDILAVDGTDVRGLRWQNRRQLLDGFVAGG